MVHGENHKTKRLEMEIKETIENNELIAEYVGRRGLVQKHLFTFPGLHDLIQDTWVRAEDMKFHKSWGWIMLVVQKINRDLYLVDIRYRLEHTTVRISQSYDGEHILTGFEEDSNPINAHYKAVVKFLKWKKENRK